MRCFCFLTVFFLFNSGVSAQWNKVFPQTENFIDIAVAPPSYVYIAVNEFNVSYVLKSSSGGGTWERLVVGDGEVTTLYFLDSLDGYAASSRKVYHTIDGGISWNATTFPASFSTPMQMVFTSNNIGYIRFRKNEIVKTTNAGESWEKLDNVPLSDDKYYDSFSFANDEFGYLISGNELYKTEDGGVTWELVESFTWPHMIHAVNNNLAYVSSSFGTYKTTNGGKNWDYTNFNSTEFAHFKNDTVGFLFTNYSDIMKTVNAADFSSIYNSHFTFSWRALSFQENIGCAIGGERAIVVSTDGGDNWKLVNITPQHGQFRDVHFSSGSEGFLIGENRGFILSDDNGKSWFYEERGMRDDLYQMAFADMDTGIVIVTNNFGYTTYDGGKTFEFNDWVPPMGGHLASKDYEMINSKVIYSVGHSTKVAKSLDGGKSWIPFEFEFENGMNEIECLDENVCHAAGIAGKVVSTWDGGEHWKVHKLLLNNDLTTMYLANSTLGFIGGKLGVILRTEDGGDTWDIIETSAGRTIVSFEFITEEKGYAVSEGAEVLRTDDRGKTWRLVQSSGLPNANYYHINTTFMRDTTTIYAIEDEGIFSWRYHPNSENEEIDPITGVASDLQVPDQAVVYPNPASSSIYFTNHQFIKEITITDMLGTVIKKMEGHHREAMVQDLSPGVYIVCIKSDQGVKMVKILKQ